MNEEIREERSEKPKSSEETVSALSAVTYRLTEDEWRLCYERTRAGASRTRNAIRVAVLGALFVGFAGYGVFVEMNTTSVLLAIFCALLAVTVVVAPQMQARRAIREAAASARETRLRETEDGLAFGAGDEWLEQPFSALTLTAYPDMVIVALPGDQRLAVPRRALDEAAWERLRTRASEPTNRPACRK